MSMRISVFGIGYVGQAYALLLSAAHEVTAMDINLGKTNSLPEGIHKTDDPRIALSNADLVIVSVPTDYNEKSHRFDVSAVEQVLEWVKLYGDKPLLVIKSTVPVGFSSKAKKAYPGLSILFSPEFLRETKALEDAKNPTRIIIGHDDSLKKEAEMYRDALLLCLDNKDVPVLFTGYDEAEAIKLFSNTFLALRVSYFNELDSYALLHELKTKDIVEGVCLDPRIGGHYNNPSFGYGGYCLPKDTKQLLENYDGVAQNLIEAIVRSNQTRKELIAEDVLLQAKKDASPVIGIYRLGMKSGSDDFRQSAMLDVLKLLKESKIPLLLYEPSLKEDIEGVVLIKDLNEFKEKATLIVANRIDASLGDCLEKVYTRDLFHRD